MKKSILIKNNKIKVLKEDAVLNLVQGKSSGIGELVKNIFGGIKNISQDLLISIKTSLGMYLNILNDKKFNEYLETGLRRSEILNDQWKKVSDGLDIKDNSVLNKLIDVTINPAEKVLNIITKSSLKDRYESEYKKGFFGDLTGLGEPISEMPGSSWNFLGNFFDYKKLSDEEKNKIDKSNENLLKNQRLTGGMEGLVMFAEWEQKLNPEQKQALDQYRLDNPDQRESMDREIQKGNYKKVINFLNDKLGFKNKKESFAIVKNNSIIIQENKENKEYNNKLLNLAVIINSLVNYLEIVKDKALKIDLKKIEDFFTGKNEIIDIDLFNDFNDNKKEEEKKEEETKIAKIIALIQFLEKLKDNHVNLKEEISSLIETGNNKINELKQKLK